MKQAIILRSDLKMSVGKTVVQACHASVGACMAATAFQRKKWNDEGSKKVVLSAKNVEVLKLAFAKAKESKLPCFMVADAGLTELEPGTITAVAIGPADDKKTDRITGSMALL